MNYEWSLAFTFRLPHRITKPKQDRRSVKKVKLFDYEPLNQFFQEMTISEGIKKYGYCAAYSESGGPHIHIELSHDGLSIPPERLRRLEERWNEIVRYRSGGLMIVPVTDKQGWQDYMYQRQQHRDINSITFFFNIRFLKQNQLGDTIIPE